MSDTDVIVVAEEDVLEGFLPPGEVLSEEQREEIIPFLQDEFNRAEGETEGRRAQWQRWRRQRLARPEKETVSYPWEGASNIEAVEAMSTTNIAFAQLKGKYLNRSPLWNVRVSREALEPTARAVERLLDYCGTSESQMNMRKHNNTIFYDGVSLGSQLGKIVWDVDRKKYIRDGQEIEVLTHDGPTFIPIRLEDFLVRANVTSLDNAPWYAVKTYYFKHELLSKAADGFFYDVEKVVEHPLQTLDDNAMAEKALFGDTPDFAGVGQYCVYEVSLFWDVDGDGTQEDITIWFEPETGTIIREEFNPLGFRDTSHLPFVTVPYMFYGLGIGWMVDQMQQEVTTAHNMAVNSAHLNSLQMFVGRPGSTIGETELKPLALLETDDPQGDLDLLTFPDVTSSARAIEENAKNAIMRATGVNYAMAGLPDQTMKSRFSPTGYEQQASTGANFLELMSKNFDDAYGEIGKKLFYLLLAYKERTELSILPRMSVEDQDLIRDLFSMSEAEIREVFSFDVKVTPMDETEDAKQQRIMSLVNMYAQYIQQMLGLSMQLYNPQTPKEMKELLTRSMVGLTTMMQENLDYMSDLPASRMVMFTDDLAVMLDMLNVQKAAQAEQMKEQLNAMESRATGAMAAPVQNASQTGSGAVAQGPTGQQPHAVSPAGPQQSGTARPGAGQVDVFTTT